MEIFYIKNDGKNTNYDLRTILDIILKVLRQLETCDYGGRAVYLPRIAAISIVGKALEAVEIGNASWKLSFILSIISLLLLG